MKSLTYVMLALVGGVLMPLGIWVAAVSAFFQSRKRRKLTSEALPHVA